MKTAKRKTGKRPAQAAPGTADLLCLLANYEAYGVGSARPSCLLALGEKESER